MQAGDFMLAVNILLSGNNYAKIYLLFKYMNMGMIAFGTFFRIHKHYCIDSIKQFWQDKRAKIIQRLSSKDGVVALGETQFINY